MNHRQSEAFGEGFIMNDPRQKKDMASDAADFSNFHLPHPLSESGDGNMERRRHLCREGKLIPLNTFLGMVDGELIGQRCLRQWHTAQSDAASTLDEMRRLSRILQCESEISIT